MYAQILVVVCIISLANVASGFRLAGRPAAFGLTRSSSTLRMAEAEVDEDFVPGDGKENPELKFSMNKRVRLGRSRDQDGKSNIWSIEPTMEVTDEVEADQTKTNLLIGGGVIGAAIACLPLFNYFSKLFPDPTDF